MIDLYSQTDRVRKLNSLDGYLGESEGVVYVMSRDQRVYDNHALQYAQQVATRAQLPLYVLFVVYDKPVARRAQEHFIFMLEGLEQVASQLKQFNIGFILRLGDPVYEVFAVAQQVNAAAIVLDANPLRGPRRMAEQVAAKALCPVYAVDTHNIVPLAVASAKQEIAARTLRPKINRLLAHWVDDSARVKSHPFMPILSGLSLDFGVVWQRIGEKYKRNGTDVSRFPSGETAGALALKKFLSDRLVGYETSRNDPTQDGLSELSPYIHFGQLSSQAVVRAVLQEMARNGLAEAGGRALVEELVIRKELSDNFCYYNEFYDSLRGAPEWAQRTLAKHWDDRREYTYSQDQFETAATHDEAWNAAQRQLTRTGKMHGYMRMYWAKKVLEWSADPDEALRVLLYLNDFYSLDGGDPNGYVGILWSVAGLHDRPWGERPIYGTVRSMVYTGLKRKFDVMAYISKYS